MAAYRYTECGLENVYIEGVDIIVDDEGESVVCIENINGLHRTIAKSIIVRNSSMTGSELRFIRTELGLTQAELALIVHREPLAISRWERGESPLDSNAETIIRLHAAEKLELGDVMSVAEISRSCVPTAGEVPISINGADPNNYFPIAA